MDGDELRSNACAGIASEDMLVLDDAARRLVDARGLFMTITETIGSALSSAGGSAFDFIEKRVGSNIREKTQEIVEQALWHFQTASMSGMDPNNNDGSWDWYHKLVAAAVGGGGGLLGAPGLLFDLPITTGLIMRSVADIARTYSHEDIGSDETRRACIEVFALGGPGVDDDQATKGYWAARSSLSHLAIEQALKQAASRFSISISEKMVSQIIPIAGAFAGAGLNYVFMGYFQEMAHVHFSIRGVEKRALDRTAVIPCFAERVKKLREARKVGSSEK
jgi:hypothetical protein